MTTSLLESFPECWEDHGYLCVLADQLEEAGHELAEAVRCLAGKKVFIICDDRLTTESYVRWDLFLKDHIRDARAYVDDDFIYNHELESHLGEDHRRYADRLPALRGFYRVSKGSPFDLLEVLRDYLNES